MEILRFYKEEKDKWYADIIGWTGRKSALRMVAGADTLLDLIANGRDEVYLHFSEDRIEGGDVLFFKKKTWINGATYRLEFYKGTRTKMKVWLCNVTLHVLGKFPEAIYFKEVEYVESEYEPQDLSEINKIHKEALNLLKNNGG